MKVYRHVGTSSTANEYMALKHAVVETVWIRDLLTKMELGDLIKGPTIMLGDNDQATQLSNEDVITAGNKFYLIDYHYTKEQIKSGHISTRRVDTKDNFADIFTKSLGPQDLNRLSNKLNGYDGLHPSIPPPYKD